MVGPAPLAALLLAAAGPAPAAATAPARARTVQPLPSLFSDDDYPVEAIRNYEEGPVGFRLQVGADGAPTGCAVSDSSGSPSLDSATCRLLMERARFEPARDAEGRARSDRFVGRIVWRLDKEQFRATFAFTLWRGCVLGEATKRVLSDLPADELARRSFAPCEEVEALFGRQIGETAPLTERREHVRSLIDDLRRQAGQVFKDPPADETAHQP